MKLLHGDIKICSYLLLSGHFVTWFTGDDYTSAPYTVTFPAGVTTASFNISETDDTIFGTNKNIQIKINSSSLPEGVNISNPDEATVIIDKDGKITFYYYICSSDLRKHTILL